MKPFRLLWVIHKWIGIVLGPVLLLVTVTGFLLLLKKDWHWIMPPTRSGTPGPAEAIRPLHEVYRAAFALERPQLNSEQDLDRIEFRPAVGVFKLRSRRDHYEIQIDATTLAVLAEGTRRSDWLEALHDGSLFGDGFHGYAMPASAIALLVLTVSGYLLWIWPMLIRRRARRRQAGREPVDPEA
jgi:uncharacterized iron-regulated membrane protein